MRKTILIAIDIDGTLLDDEGCPDLDLISTLRAFQSNFSMVLVTARPRFGVIRLVSDLHLVCGLVCLNGAIAYNSVESLPLFQTPIPLAECRKFLKRASTTDVIAMFAYSPDTWFAWGQTEIITQEADLTDGTAVMIASVFELPIQSILKYVAVLGSENDAEAAIKGLQGIKTDSINLQISRNNYVEVTGSGVDKGQGLTKFLGPLRDQYYIIAIGDSNNDIPMFIIANESFAMGHSSPALKAISTTVLPSPIGDHLAMMIERIFLRNK